MKYFSAFLFLLLVFVSQGQESSKHTVYFAVDKASITNAEAVSLNRFLDSLKNRSEITSIQLTGHTDSDASSDYNLNLSQKRVEMVASFFKDLVALDKITEKFVGEEQPLNANLSEDEKKQNRRVDILVEHKTLLEAKKESTIQDLYKKLEQKMQTFCINPKGDTTIVLDQGTLIYFPPEPFNKKGSKCITINAKEFYKKSDMILENLSTMSDGNLLESGGMLYIEALDSYSKKPMQLSSGKQITIALPTDSLRDDMGTFFGKRDPHSQQMNWEGTDLQAGGINLAVVKECAEFNGRGLRYCEPCRFFFCRIKRFGKGVKGIFNKMQRAENQSYRQCLRNSRRNIPTYTTIPVTTSQGLISQCAKLDSLFKAYGVDNYESLLLAMNKEQMERYRVKTLAQLRDTLNKIRMAEAESNMAAGTSNYDDRQFFLLNSTKMGWINCDAFSKQTGAKIVMNTDLEYDPQTDCKVVFTNIKGIMPGGIENGKFSFANVPVGLNIWLIGIRYIDDKIFLSMKETKSARQLEFAKFRQVTVEELKAELGKMD